ncbi:MAG: hypothetical protein AAF366_03655, partial [Pseudomonadota bacterium]
MAGPEPGPRMVLAKTIASDGCSTPFSGNNAPRNRKIHIARRPGVAILPVPTGEEVEMKFSIERAALLEAVSQAQAVVERRNTIPIL